MVNDKYMETLPKYKTNRTNSGSLEKIFFDRKYGAKKNPGSGEKIDQNDAI